MVRVRPGLRGGLERPRVAGRRRARPDGNNARLPPGPRDPAAVAGLHARLGVRAPGVAHHVVRPAHLLEILRRLQRDVWAHRWRHHTDALALPERGRAPGRGGNQFRHRARHGSQCSSAYAPPISGGKSVTTSPADRRRSGPASSPLTRATRAIASGIPSRTATSSTVAPAETSRAVTPVARSRGGRYDVKVAKSLTSTINERRTRRRPRRRAAPRRSASDR